MRELLASAGRATFTELVAGCTSVIQVVTRFLGLLNLYRTGAVLFDQDEPMALLTVRWTGAASATSSREVREGSDGPATQVRDDDDEEEYR